MTPIGTSPSRISGTPSSSSEAAQPLRLRLVRESRILEQSGICTRALDDRTRRVSIFDQALETSFAGLSSAAGLVGVKRRKVNSSPS